MGGGKVTGNRHEGSKVDSVPIAEGQNAVKEHREQARHAGLQLFQETFSKIMPPGKEQYYNRLEEIRAFKTATFVDSRSQIEEKNEPRRDSLGVRLSLCPGLPCISRYKASRNASSPFFWTVS